MLTQLENADDSFHFANYLYAKLPWGGVGKTEMMCHC